MNDRYLYRAKRTDNGEWITGYLLVKKKDFYICEKPYECMDEYSSLNGQSYGFGGFKFVYPSTICQCTGLKDKNGKMIWENDITLRTSVTGTHKGKIIYSSDGSFCQKNFETTFENLLIHSESYFEVIGNIFDNPELLEVGE